MTTEQQIRKTLKEISRLGGDPPGPVEGHEALIVCCWNISDLVNLLIDQTGGMDGTFITGSSNDASNQ